jgi:hydrogenase maturation protein HypF
MPWISATCAATDGPDKLGHDGREKVLLRPPPFPDSYRPLSFAPLLAAFADAPPDPRTGAELFHGTLIEGLAAMAEAGTASSGLSALCLGGGCMMNRVLAEGLAASLSARGLTPVLARRLPPNDGGLSLGQAVMARLTVMEGN